jgi:hypothetical protein
MTRLKIDGITDDRINCECCSRTNLKRTVRLLVLDADGTTIGTTYYGTECAARATRRTNANVTKIARERQAEADRRAARNAEYAEVVAYADELLVAAQERSESESGVFEHRVLGRIYRDAAAGIQVAARLKASIEQSQERMQFDAAFAGEARGLGVAPHLKVTLARYRSALA